METIKNDSHPREFGFFVSFFVYFLGSKNGQHDLKATITNMAIIQNNEKSYQRFSLCPSGPYSFQTTLRASGLFMAVAYSHGGKNIAMLVFLPWAVLLRPFRAISWPFRPWDFRETTHKNRRN
jgi:hypothetical protein